MGLLNFLQTGKWSPIISDKLRRRRGPVVPIPDQRGRQTALPTGTVLGLQDAYSTVTPSFNMDAIPLIRNLYKVNQNLGLALHDMVQLTNTGHRIYFDPAVKSAQVDKMRKHLEITSKNWGDGVCGINGLVNKMISQIYVAGALSMEWVIKQDGSGIDNAPLVNPENIRFKLDPKLLRYKPYHQAVRLSSSFQVDGIDGLIPLNTETYKYFALNGDTEEPYGFPPFLSALEDLGIQRDMLTNIAFIVKQLGVLGFIDVLLEKPGRLEHEKESTYEARLKKLLTDTKNNIKGGLADGILVGYNEDHKYEFNATTKNVGGLEKIVGLNQQLVANGLKFPASFMGGSNSLTETQITIVFTKMLSQLKNVQEIIKASLVTGYRLELMLAGFRFDYLDVEFNPSTITDDLKIVQAEEIKIRNARQLYADGIISQDGYADLLGYQKADQQKPRVALTPPKGGPNGIQNPVIAKRKRKDGKNDSARKGRDKNKPQPKRKDNVTKKS